MRRALAVGALIVALAVSFLAPASAAQLVLTRGQHPYAFASARCDDSVSATTPATSGTTAVVQLLGLDVACAGLPVAVQLYDPTTARTVSVAATVPAAGGSLQLTLSGAYTPAATAVLSVTIASWPIPTTWSYTPPTLSTGCVVVNPGGNVVNGKSCSLSFGGNTDGSGTSWNVKVTVSTTETNAVTWRATVDFADLAKFPFLARYVGEYTGGATYGPLASGFCSGGSRQVTFSGAAGPGTDQVVAGTSRTFDFVGTSSGPVANVVYSCP